LGKDANVYALVEAPGTIDQIEVRSGCRFAAFDVYDALMPDVVGVKDLGSSVIDGKECNHLAFRNKELDWQIWIAAGDRLYPRRYVITISVNPQPEARRYGKAVTVGPPSGVTLPCYPEKLTPADTLGLLFVCHLQHAGNEGGSHDITRHWPVAD
jgi:hypothetical protein